MYVLKKLIVHINKLSSMHYLAIYYALVSVMFHKLHIDLSRIYVEILDEYFNRYVSTDYILFIDKHYIQKIMYKFTYRYLSDRY